MELSKRPKGPAKAKQPSGAGVFAVVAHPRCGPECAKATAPASVVSKTQIKTGSQLLEPSGCRLPTPY